MINIQQNKIYAANESETSINSAVSGALNPNAPLGAISLWYKKPNGSSFAYKGTVDGSPSEMETEFAGMLSEIYDPDIIVVITTTTIIE